MALTFQHSQHLYKLIPAASVPIIAAAPSLLLSLPLLLPPLVFRCHLCRLTQRR
jgi:hypothetical protein